MPDSPHIVVFGSANIDMVVKVPHLPRPGETVRGGTFKRVQGGKGANQAVAASRAGGRVTFVAAVGADLLGQSAIAAYLGENIDITYVYQIEQHPTGVALINVSEDGENAISVAPGANNELSPERIAQAVDALEGAKMALVQLEVPYPSVQAAVALAHAQGVPVLLNPAPARPLDPETLAKVHILVVNRIEAEMLSGHAPVASAADAAAAARLLRAQGPHIVIVTLGTEGTYVLSEEEEALLPAFLVTAVDSTAAGDVFCGSLSVALSRDLPLMEAVRFASAASALSVTKLGAQPSAPERTAIHAFLERQAEKE
ncbi:MAG: ribokinase [Bacteroidetes bacterium]|nr:MAG: ribokinase [Bacteroidota bacterium]